LNKMKKEELVSLFLRIGIAFTFIYVGIFAFLNPSSWIGFIPEFVESFISRESFLIVHVVTDIALGAWLLSGKKTYYAAVLSAVFLFGITIFNFGALDIVFRDVGLFFAAVALAILSK